jgi:hypothetical protein
MRKRPSHIEFTNKTTIQKEEEKSSNKKWSTRTKSEFQSITDEKETTKKSWYYLFFGTQTNKTQENNKTNKQDGD